MKARVANFGDVNRMAKVCQLLHAKSSWKNLTFSPTHVRKNLMKMVRDPGLDALIVENDERAIRGVLLASMAEFFICKQWYATDVHFMCEAGGIQLLNEFKRWALEHGATKIVMGIANDDPSNRTARFYEMVGMDHIGDAWVWDLTEFMENAA